MGYEMDAWIYLRFSTPRQEKGSSKDRQIEACRAFIKAKGWNEAGIVEDLGRSAWKGVHLTSGNLGKFAKRIFDHEFAPGSSVLVSENLDRFSRQKARVTQRWIEDICDAGMSIATVAGNKVFTAENLSDNLLSILEILFIAEGANRYVENLSIRSKGSYEARLKQARIDNTVIHSVGPAWLKAVGERPNIKWQPIPERVEIVREIFNLTIAGQAPWTIARNLNARPECRSFTGIKWERTSISKIVQNPAIDGDRVIGEGKASKPTGEVLRGYYGEPIIPADVVAEARAMLNRRARRGSGRNSGVVVNLFGQSIRCGECGGRMMATGYQCRYTIGSSSLRPGIIYSATGTINTSDAREKEWIQDGFTADELAAATAIQDEIGSYKWLSSVEEKGDEARTHYGIRSQNVAAIASAHGLDPHAYGWFCYDAWDAVEAVEADEDGRGEVAAQAGGDRYGIRPDELLFWLTGANHARLAAIEAKLAV
jgi:DNA invertase Pin-like site-specific DNA recombinase